MTEPQRFQTIVVPMDFSPPAERALAFARQLAQAAGPSQLLLVNAYAVPLELEALAAYGSQQVFDELAGETDKQLQALVARLQEADVSAESMGSPGRPDDVIVGLAQKRKADLIVMGTHGRTGLPHVLLGSVAERVIRSAPCPVITVK